MKISVRKPSESEIAEMERRPTWEKEAGSFAWFYDEPETCYLLEGDVEVATDDGEVVRFGAGDLVRFPAGLSCRWTVHTPVRKHYRMG